MEASFFGEWLVRVGAIDAKQLDDAVEQMRGINRRLDDLAVERGWLNAEQATRLHGALEPPAEAMELRTPGGRGWMAFRY